MQEEKIEETKVKGKGKVVGNLKEDLTQVYEIGYLLVPSIPEEKVASEVSLLKEILSKKDAEFIGEETPELRTLAYTMIKKIGTTNHRFDKGYFGWFKFCLSRKDIENVKKSFETNPSMLRVLVINTIRENTYLGKKAPVANIIKEEEVVVPTVVEHLQDIPAVAVPATVEEMDKSIDEMVKEA
jgi:ribosomal protein S6